MDDKQGLGLTQLGNKVDVAATPEASVLERITITESEILRAIIRFTCPEFTSLCPVTGQPDFARIYIDFLPNKYLVESKSLKLFLTAFRNHGSFHETCTAYIARRLMETLEPRWMRVTGIWYPRGGIPIDIFWQSGLEPVGFAIPPIERAPYAGR